MKNFIEQKKNNNNLYSFDNQLLPMWMSNLIRVSRKKSNRE
jgi:hypothetical protein